MIHKDGRQLIEREYIHLILYQLFLHYLITTIYPIDTPKPQARRERPKLFHLCIGLEHKGFFDSAPITVEFEWILWIVECC